MSKSVKKNLIYPRQAISLPINDSIYDNVFSNLLTKIHQEMKPHILKFTMVEYYENMLIEKLKNAYEQSNNC